MHAALQAQLASQLAQQQAALAAAVAAAAAAHHHHQNNNVIGEYISIIKIYNAKKYGKCLIYTVMEKTITRVS